MKIFQKLLIISLVLNTPLALFASHINGHDTTVCNTTHSKFHNANHLSPKQQTCNTKTYTHHVSNHHKTKSSLPSHNNHNTHNQHGAINPSCYHIQIGDKNRYQNEKHNIHDSSRHK